MNNANDVAESTGSSGKTREAVSRLKSHGEDLPGEKTVSRSRPPEAVALWASLDTAFSPGELAIMGFKAWLRETLEPDARRRGIPG